MGDTKLDLRRMFDSASNDKGELYLKDCFCSSKSKYDSDYDQALRELDEEFPGIEDYE